MNSHLKSQGKHSMAKRFEIGIPAHGLSINQVFPAKLPKRIRVCLRCKNILTKRHKCEHCGLRFHDGPFLSWLKKMWGVSPR